MQCIILHGAFGSKDGNWFPWLKKELEKMGHTVFLEQFPVDDWDDIVKRGKENTNTKQNLTDWLAFFENHILSHLDRSEPVVFFGHSLSPVFILHVIDHFNLQTKGAVFASPFLEALNKQGAWQFDVVNRTFYKSDFNWEKLARLITHSYVLYGTDDPYVPNTFPIEFGSKLQSTIIPVEGGKHLGDTHKEFPLVLDLFKKITA